MLDLSVRSASLQSTRFSIRAARVGVAAMLVLSGCTRLQVRLGSKVHLEAIPVKSMEARLAKGQGIVPGQKLSLVAVITEADGKVLQTEGAGQGKVLWSEVKVTASVVTANKKGVVSLPRDPRISDGKMPHVTITVPSHPDIRAELDIPVRYDYNFVSNFSGSSGTSGTPGSLDPNNPSPGGNGSNGSDGSNGQDGGRGGDAPPVQIRVALRSGSHPLLQVDVTAPGGEEVFLVDPHGGSLTVAADGGSGGSGGRGGRGGRGGSGGIGSPNGSSGRDGLDGRNGWDGSSGSGGRITVTHDPAAAAYSGAIHLSNRGGPAPVFNEEPVAPLW